MQALEKAEKTAMVVLAHYVLFVSLKPVFEDQLYQESVLTANAQAVDLLHALSSELAAVKACLEDEESHRLAGRCLLQCTVAAFERVLLDGGDLRYDWSEFHPQPVRLFSKLYLFIGGFRLMPQTCFFMIKINIFWGN